MRPKVTVYITCYNYGKHFEKAFLSVKNQIFKNWELIIIDDFSKDNSVSVINNLVKNDEKNIKKYFNKENKGLAYCANLALENAKGEYIIRLDADDYLDEAALLVMASFLDENPNIALVYPNYYYIDEERII